MNDIKPFSAIPNSLQFIPCGYRMTKANLPSIAAGGEVGAQFLKTA
jgi:hypothetical protein